MDAARWPEVRGILESTLQLPPDERLDFVAAACGNDSELRAAVISLIFAYDQAQYLEHPSEPAPDPWPGARLGPWLLGRRLGQGGMGAVYEATRADSQYQQRAAVKLVQAATLSDDVARRFWNERQTLAQLEHPCIARLLDGGTTAQGVPYLVMEYVEGIAIDSYCAERRLCIHEILLLFRDVCSAVEHAHRHLVVHRDIKPGNILVTAQGAPKLLDFGIAKLLDSADDLTRTFQRPMTPAYASPEQVRGEPVTTSSDVYSLGVLLYVLLTGVHPYRRAGSASQIQAAILEQDLAAPSTAPGIDERTRKSLRGDLDAIVMTALQGEMARRYPSVESFSLDLARHLQGVPVRARKDTAAYLAGRFIHRHRVPVLAATLAALGLIVAAGISLEFARQARAERARAAGRFNEVRRLAHFFLFELDDAIRSGTTAARKSVVEKGLEYLNRLSADSRGDVALERELLAGYSKIGELQGNIFAANIGDVPGARASYLRALQIATRLHAADLHALQSRGDLAQVHRNLGEIAATAGNLREALENLRQAAGLLDMPPLSGRETVAASLQVHSRIAWVLYHMGDYASALEEYRRYGELAARAYGDHPTDPAQRRALIYASERRGETLARMQRLPEGVALLEQALADYRMLRNKLPGSQLDRDVAAVHIILGELLSDAGRLSESLAQLREATKDVKSMISGDPRNREYRRDLAETETLQAGVLLQTGRRAEARNVTRQALKAMRAELDAASQWDLYQYARLLATTPFGELRNPAEALRCAEKVLLLTDGSDPSVLDLLARALDGAGQRLRAIQVEEKALALLPPAPSDLRSTIVKDLAALQAGRPLAAP